MKQGLFFDLDGTLADSERAHWEAWRSATLPFDIDLSWSQYEKYAIGHPDPEILSLLVGRFLPGIRELEANQILATKEQNFVELVGRRSSVNQGVASMIRELSGLPLALVTSSPRKEARAQIDSAGLFRYFSAVVTLDDVTTPKPDPEPYVLAARMLGVRDGIAFEDSAAGRASARAAGLSVVEVPGPSHLAELVRNALVSVST